MNPQFKEYIEKEGVFKAIDHFHTLKKSDTTTLLFTEKQINTLGYEYLRKGKTEESIALFALNVEENHESFNVYDSLGEAYFVKGEFELASKYYKEALRRNPANKNSEEYLSRIQKKMIPDI
jgi:tetratricopeptide (TPR) repeat protein